MQIDQFSKDEFEQVLEDYCEERGLSWKCLGLVGSEFEYVIKISKLTWIAIRSSIWMSGFAGDCGEDSIRVWLVEAETLESQGGKISRFITRLPGWQERLYKQLDFMLRMARYTKRCPCGGMIGVYRSKKRNSRKGYYFRACSDRECQETRFEWLWDSKGRPIDEKTIKVVLKKPIQYPRVDTIVTRQGFVRL